MKEREHGEFFTLPDRNEAERNEEKPNTANLESIFIQLNADYGSAEFYDPEILEKLNYIRSELEKLMASEGQSWDMDLENNHIYNIKNMVTGHFAKEDPKEVAQDIINYLNKFN